MTNGTFKYPTDGQLYDVEYSYFPGCMGTMEQPPEYESVEIISVKNDGKEIELSDDLYVVIEEYFWDNRPPEIDEPDLD